MAKKVDPVLKVLRGMRKLLGKPERWTKGYFAYTAAGKGVNETDPHAVCWCLSGARAKVALSLALPRYTGADELHSEVERITRGRQVHATTFNDYPRRTHAQVLRLLDRTIARREKELATATPTLAE